LNYKSKEIERLFKMSADYNAKPRNVQDDYKNMLPMLRRVYTCKCGARCKWDIFSTTPSEQRIYINMLADAGQCPSCFVGALNEN